MESGGACYREFAPCGALRPHVRAFFTFISPDPRPAGRFPIHETIFAPGERICSPLFADGHVSIVFSFSSGYWVEDLWPPGSPSGSHVIGPMVSARQASHGDRVFQVGAYLRAGQARAVTGSLGCELTDRIVPFSTFWGAEAGRLEDQLGRASDDAARIELMERSLLRRIGGGRFDAGSLDVSGLARHALQNAGIVSVRAMAEAAGVSRQHLSRAFREQIGVTPKLYCRLSRFRAALAQAKRKAQPDWAGIAAEFGYTDQSHLIAEFRQFSSLTPARMQRERRFHPFMDATDH